MKYLKLFEELAPLLNLKDNIDNNLTDFICSNYPKGSKILEISCGNAADSIFLKEKGYDITCTEFNDEYVHNAKSIGLKCIKQNTLEKFPFKNSEFDLIYSRLGLHYFTEEQLYDIFKELKRIGKSILFTVKLEEDKGNEWTGKVILTPEIWKKIIRSKFNIDYFNIKTGILYGNKSRWIEIYATSRLNEGRLLKSDEKEEIRSLFQTFFDQEGWRETKSYGEPDSGITYHIQNSYRYIFDSELDKGKPIHLSNGWDGKEIHQNDRTYDYFKINKSDKQQYIHGSLVINVMFGEEYTWNKVTDFYHEIKDFVNDLNDLGYPGYIWRPSKRNLRIHISIKEADRFLKKTAEHFN